MTSNNNNGSTHTPITRAAARGETATIVELFALTLADATVLRFTPSHTSNIGFGNETYRPLPITASGFRYSGHGSPPKPSLEVSNHSGLFSAQLTNPDLIGMSVLRIVTFAEECDAPIGNGGGACFTPERWVIERIARLDEATAVIEMGAEADLDVQTLPARVMLADLCQHRYRRWDATADKFDYSDATCPYVGSACFDANGQPTTDKAKDGCSLRLGTGCKKRFVRQLPFLGFPGLG